MLPDLLPYERLPPGTGRHRTKRREIGRYGPSSIPESGRHVGDALLTP
jgi:hypothetical protein